MSTIKTRWLRDNNGDKVAPKTLASQVMTSEGINVENKINDIMLEKADVEHEHTVSDITDLTASATELNYMDGVKSNVQEQIDSLESNKVSTSTLTANYYTKTDVDSLEFVVDNDNLLEITSEEIISYFNA